MHWRAEKRAPEFLARVPPRRGLFKFCTCATRSPLEQPCEGWILRKRFSVQWTILEVIRCFRVQKQWILEFESAFHSSKHGLPLSKPQFRTQFPTQKYANHPAVIGNGHFNSSHRWGHSFGRNRFSKWNLEFSLQSYLRINQMCNYTCRSSFERAKEVPPQRNPPLRALLWGEQIQQMKSWILPAELSSNQSDV